MCFLHRSDVKRTAGNGCMVEGPVVYSRIEVTSIPLFSTFLVQRARLFATFLGQGTKHMTFADILDLLEPFMSAFAVQLLLCVVVSSLVEEELWEVLALHRTSFILSYSLYCVSSGFNHFLDTNLLKFLHIARGGN